MEAVNQCPKCGFSSNEPFTECPSCGVVPARFLESQAAEPEGPERPASSDSGSPKGKILLIVLILLAVWGGWTWIRRDSGVEKSGSARTALKISTGERVDLKEHLAEGRYTVFLFYADW